MLYMKVNVVDDLVRNSAWQSQYERRGTLMSHTVVLKKIVVRDPKRCSDFLGDGQDISQALVGQFMEFGRMLLRNH
jgi:hypothetical protein